MQLCIAFPLLALLASTTAAPAAAGEQGGSRHLRRACKVKQQQNNQVKTTIAAPVATTATTATASSEELAPTESSATAAPAASSAAAASGDGGAPDSGIGGMLKLHNDFRSHYGAGALTWSSELASYAQNVANTCKFEHSNGPYGENLAVGVGGGYNVESAFNAWGDESKDYDWDNPGFKSGTGHFTQVVWKDTSELGCASTLCDDGTIFTGYGQKSLYVVCEYRKPGNMVGNNGQYFRDNVGAYQG